jgi:hypothetical protein
MVEGGGEDRGTQVPEEGLSPSELDRLEDALEHLDADLDGDPALAEQLDGALSDALRERFDDYRAITAMARDAWPMEEPRDDVLDDVLAEARRVATQRTKPTPTSWWERWRPYVVPAFALAATAGLVLWVARPGRDIDPLVQNPELAAKNEASQAEGDERQADDQAALPTTPSEAPEPEESPEETEESTIESPGGVSKEDSAPEAKKAASKAKPSKALGGGSKGNAGPGGAPMPEPAPQNAAPKDKDASFAELEKADALRRRGKCGTAKSLYRALMDQPGPAQARARAGYGMCLEFEGKPGQAEAYYDEDQRAFIDRELEGMRDLRPKKARKKQSKAAPDFEQAMDEKN